MRITPIFILLATVGMPAFAETPQAGAPSGPPTVAAARPGRAPVQARRTAQRRAGAVQTERTTRTLQLGPKGEIELVNVAGDIVVTRASGNDTTVEIVKTAHGSSDEDAQRMLELVHVMLNVRGNRAEVKAMYPQGERTPRGARRPVRVSVELAVSAPAATRVRAQSIAGSISVTDLSGELWAETVNGDVQISNAGQVASAKSISGNVEIVGSTIGRPIQVSTVSGEVALRRVQADQITAGAISGGITLEDVTCSRVKAQTVSGGVRLTGPLPANARYELISHSGNLHVGISGNTGFAVDATSFSGSVRSDFPVTLEPAMHARRPQNGVRGVHGDGSAVLNLTTFSGNIVISKQ